MRTLLLITFLAFSIPAFTQQKSYTTANAHSHNDYEQERPFEWAYNVQFGSIEADIFLIDGNLYVAHEESRISRDKTLQAVYLDKIKSLLNSGNGKIYPKQSNALQLLIDIKTAAEPTMAALVSLLNKYPEITRNKSVSIVVSGNRPGEHLYNNYPEWIHFDGRLNEVYSATTLSRIALLSDDFKDYVQWNGAGTPPASDSLKLAKLVARAHQLKKPVRFWGSPDNPATWKFLMGLKVDYINTDRIKDLAAYLDDPSVFTRETILDKMELRNDSMALMPYNRIIRSAGSVVRFGLPDLENHALDVAALPGGKSVVIEDRYGLVVLDIISRKILQRWTFGNDPDHASFINNYSGIKVFQSGKRIFMAWGASSRDSEFSALMLAEWKDTIMNPIAIPFKKVVPASNAIPNDVFIEQQHGETYLYVVLNGNDQLAKVRLSDRSIIWQVSTGMAPYGVTLANRKIYVTNWAGERALDTTRERAGIPWGAVYTDPRTGATSSGTVSVFDPVTGQNLQEIRVGLHPNAIRSGKDGRFVYVCSGSDDEVIVIDTHSDKVIEQIRVGLLKNHTKLGGSSPNGLVLNADNSHLYVSNGMDNAVAVISLGKNVSVGGNGQSYVKGYIPTEAYPAGLELSGQHLVVANLESGGANVVRESNKARSIHNQLGSVSIIALPGKSQLEEYTRQVYEMNLVNRIDGLNLPPRVGVSPLPVPERIGEPSVFKHVIYIIKENKTYDQVYGDIPEGRGDKSLCIFGNQVTPNMHALARQYGWMDNYYASGKSSAEGHQWTDAAMVSDYVEKSVRAWLRSYPHRQEDAMVYNKSGFIWNQALDHGKSVRIFGEACKTIYDEKLGWAALYSAYKSGQLPPLYNTSTIARIRPYISPQYPDCDNITFSDQQRADEFIREWRNYEQGDSLPNLLILSLPNDHSAGTSPGFPTPDAMVADNDLAVGRIMQVVTSSKYWDSTVVFITQDDSQSGWDHISAYRTVGLVISPYSTGKLVTTNYNQTSMVRTIEQILGIPPMNIMDATAKPMFDCFSMKKTGGRYNFLSNTIPLDQMNPGLNTLHGKARKYALQSLDEVFNEVDGGEDDKMNRILWFYAKGNAPYPEIRK